MDDKNIHIHIDKFPSIDIQEETYKKLRKIESMIEQEKFERINLYKNYYDSLREINSEIQKRHNDFQMNRWKLHMADVQTDKDIWRVKLVFYIVMGWHLVDLILRVLSYFSKA